MVGLLLGHRVQSTTEEQDVGFRLVEHVVFPSSALLDAQVPPLGLGHQVVGHSLDHIRRQMHVSVLVLAIVVLVAVGDTVHHGLTLGE